MLDSIKVRTKLILVLILTSGSLVLAVGLAAWILYDKLIDERVAKLRGIVEVAHGLAASLEKKSADGSITRGEAISRFAADIRSMKYDDEKNYLFMITMDGVMISNVGYPDLEGKNVLQMDRDSQYRLVVSKLIRAVDGQSENKIIYHVPVPGEHQTFRKIAYVQRFDPWNALIASGVAVSDIDNDFWSVLFHLGIVTLVLIIVTAGTLQLISWNITKPLNSLGADMRKLADGDLSSEISAIKRSDELGSMARKVLLLRDGLLAAEKMRQSQAAERESRLVRGERIESCISSFERAIGAVMVTVGSTVNDLRAAAEAMAATSAQTSQQSATVAAACEQATNNVQMVASATEELTLSIGDIGRQVALSTEKITEAVSQVYSSDEQVRGLTSAAERIGNIVKLIADIASQTNLLALNATIEAARAGNAGKGFAVVASEVKALATQTARATDEIAAQVNAIQGATQTSARSIQEVTRTIAEVNQTTAAIASAIEKQGLATRQIASNVQQAANGTAEVSFTIIAVRDGAHRVQRTADQVLASAEELSRKGGSLQSEVYNFLNEVRVGDI